MTAKPMLCTGMGLGFPAPYADKLRAVKSAGFDAFFSSREKGMNSADMEAVAGEAARLGLVHQSIHAPFYGMDDVWHSEDDDLANIMINDLLAAVDDCRNLDVPIAVMHIIIGMDNVTPTERGLDRMARVIDRAVKRGVTIGFENTEGEMYLDALFGRYGEIPNVGFCFDSGHEMCYNHSEDMLGRFGSRLVCTHLNDNLGQTGEKITFYDDAHLLPFDGIADWQGIARRMHACGYNGTLTFEVNFESRPGQNANDRYVKMTLQEYVNKAYERAVRFRELYTSAAE